MDKTTSSRLPGFYQLTLEERITLLKKASSVVERISGALTGEAGLTTEQADHMIENVVGTFGLPLGIAANFLIDGRDVLVPMVIEEPSVVAGASFMAKLVRVGGGFHTEVDPPEMIGQIQLLEVEEVDKAMDAIEDHTAELLEAANRVDPTIAALGGGAREIQVRHLPETPAGSMLIVHVIYDTRDAMGANTLNTVAERLAPRLEQLTGGRAHLRIISNLADRRLATATCRIPAAALKFDRFQGEQVRDGIVEAWAFAESDPYRAATHNKGIMNGIDAVVIATGNDWRAVEAGAHAYAAREGRYRSLSRWWVDQEGSLAGELTLPLALGTIGGATRVHPTAKANLALMEITKSTDLASVIVSVGLAQNLAALRALATEGIQRGHMSLHARQLAVTAGAEGDMVDRVSERMVNERDITLERAEELLGNWPQDDNR